MSTELKLAVFDCDGTLVDSLFSIIESMNAAFDRAGFEQPDELAIRQMVGLPLDITMEKLLPGQSEADYKKLITGYSTYWQDLRHAGKLHQPLYPGVRETLEHLTEQGWLLGVATGKSRPGLDHTLEEFGLTDYFITLQTADRARGKPDPDMMHRAMAEAGAEAGSTVMIGDTTYDILMSVNAGTLAIGVEWGYHCEEELKQAGAQEFVKDYPELTSLLDQIWEK